MKVLAVIVVLLCFGFLAEAGCPGAGGYCGYCGCDGYYGSAYSCQTGPNYSCCWGWNQYSTANPVCGNNVTECEPCDDGNTVNGDGCSSTCTVEAGWSCLVQVATQNSLCTPICSNGCGNGTCVSPNVCKCTNGFGGSTCNVTLVPGPTTCSGSGITCRYCGCDAMYGPGWTCRTNTDHTCCWGNNLYDAPATPLYCGNGVNECEPCDDGNIVNGDGCSSTCTIEPGWSCTVNNTQTSYCVAQNRCLIPSMNTCSANATCTSTSTGVSCTCNAGLYGDGHTCVPNECLNGNNTCQAWHTCSKTSTVGYTCNLKPGLWYTYNDGTPGGQLCTNSTSDAYWCMQPFNATKQQYIEIPNFQIPTTGYTVEVKWKANTPSSWQRVFECGAGPNNNNVLFAAYGLNSGMVYQVYTNDSVSTSLTSNTITPYTYGTIGRMFLSHNTDGSIIIATNQASNMNDVLTYPNTTVNRTATYIGRSLYPNDGYLNGNVGEIRIWNTPRTFAGYTKYKDQHLDPYTTYPGLIALYQVDKTCGTRLLDLTGNGKHAYLRNFAASEVFPSCYGRGTCSAAVQCTCKTGYTGRACSLVK